MNQTISYQGEPGANSHIICAQAYPDWTPLPCPTFEDAFAAVKEGRATRAMIPIENSIAGRVAPEMPREVVIDEIVAMNDLGSSALQVGQPLLTPRYR